MKFLEAIKRIEMPTRIFLGGLVVALFVLGVGYTAVLVNKLHLVDLVAQCESKNSGATQEKDKDGWENVPIVCEPEILAQLSSNPPSVGIQAQIEDVYRQGQRKFDQAIFIAYIVAFFSVVPYAWYFLLRRVRELHNAIMGK